MELMRRERLEDMFEIVKKHEKTNTNIKHGLEVSLQELTSRYAKYEDSAAYRQKIVETNYFHKSVFMAERLRYFKRHFIRMREFKSFLSDCEEYLNKTELVDHGRQKVLDLRAIQQFKTANAFAQIIQWELTYDDKSFEQSKIVDSTLIPNDEHLNVIRKNHVRN